MDKIEGSIVFSNDSLEDGIHDSKREEDKDFCFNYAASVANSDYFENESIFINIYGHTSLIRSEDESLELQSLNATSFANLFHTEGIELLSNLDGNYLITIYDKIKNIVYITRDYFGKWPIYYYQNKKGFFWSSSLKSLIQSSNIDFKISKKAINLYFQLTYIPSPFCIYEEVYKLEPNCYLKFDCNTFNYTLNESEQSLNKFRSTNNFNEAKNMVHDKVLQSVKNNISTDKEMGTFLSGGVDSSIVSLCYSKLSASPIKTFSLGFYNKQYDETNKSQVVAKLIGSEHHEYILQSKDLMADIDKIITSFDEPFADSSALPSYYIASKASDEVNTVLTGDGGDEVFGGYNKHYMGKMNKIYTRLFHPKVHNTILKLSSTLLSQKNDTRGKVYKINRLLNAIDYGGDFYYNIISLGFQKDEINELFNNEYIKDNLFDYFKKKMSNKSGSIHDFRMIDKMISLEGDLIVKVSKTSDLSNLETYSPLLNKDLWFFSNSLPDSYLMKGWNKKYILKEAFKGYFPKSFFESSKKGFGVPVGDWLRKELKDELRYYSERELLKVQGIFNIEYVINLVSNHINAVEDNTFKVWSFFCFQKWYFNTKLSKKI